MNVQQLLRHPDSIKHMDAHHLILQLQLIIAHPLIKDADKQHRAEIAQNVKANWPVREWEILNPQSLGVKP